MYVSKEYNLHIAGEKTHMEEYERVIEYPKSADMGKLKATLVDGLVSVYGERSCNGFVMLEANRPFGFIDSPTTTRSVACTGMDLHPTEKHVRRKDRITLNTVSPHITHRKEDPKLRNITESPSGLVDWTHQMYR